MKRVFLALIIGLASANAVAEETNKPASADAAPAPAQQEAPAPADATPPTSAAEPVQEAAPATPAAAAATKPKAARAPAVKLKTAHAPAAATHAATGLSQSKFLGMLYSEIAKRRPEKNSAGPGVVSASFRVNSSGKIDNVSIKNSTSAAHAEIVKKILAKVQAPPPPGGVFEGVQDFKFH